jgi:hypothetical protein
MTQEEYIKQALSNQNASPLKRNQFNPTSYAPSYKPKYSSDFGSNFTSKYATNPDLDTSQGLYRIADQAGLKEKADQIIRDNSGEDLNKIFSGGFISDAFDVLNVLSYGMVGVLKGKSFEEGVKQRESFSDKDSLGQYGLTGVIAGLGLDIVTDPLTYIAPWTIAKKIPGVTRVAETFKDATLGREVVNTLTNSAGETVEFLSREGNKAQTAARTMLQKISYMFGADPTFREAHDNMLRNIGAETTKAVKMVKALSSIDPKVTENLLQRDSTGRFMRSNIDDLRKTLSSEDFAKVEPIWSSIDALGKKMVDVGLLGSEKYEENLGKYIKNVYAEYELADKKGFWGFKNTKNLTQKSRKEGLTEDKMKELGQIDNPAYITGATMMHMIKDIHTAEFFKDVSKFASKTELPGFKQVSDTRKFMTSQGANAQALIHIKQLNERINPLLNDLEATFRADKEVMSEIRSVRRDLKKMSDLQGQDLDRFFNDRGTESELFKRGAKYKIIPERLQIISNQIKKFDTFEEMISSRAGIQLESLHLDGVLERNGFPGGEKAMREFFDVSKNTFTPSTTGKTKATSSIEKRVNDLKVKLEAAGRGEITKLKKAEIAKLQKQYDKAIKKIEEMRAKRAGRMSKGTDVELSNKIERLDGLRKNTAYGKEAFRQMEMIAGKIARAQGRVGKAREKLMKEIENELSKFEDKLVDVKTTKLVEMQKRIDYLTSKESTLTEIDKRSINDSFRSIEKQLNEARLDKDDLIDSIHNNKVSDLAGKWIPEDMHQYIDEIVNPTEAFGNKIIAEFKFMKVVFNPGTHIRNILSNRILNWWKLGIGPWRLDLDVRAYKELKNEGKMYKEWASMGGGADTFASNEIKNILESPDTTWLKGKYWTNTKRKIGDIYQGEEAYAKMTAYIAMRDNGLSKIEAYKAAESATFNYAQVTPFVKKLRTSLFGVPFITFAVKTVPVIADTLYKNPHRIGVFGKIKNDIKNASDIDETEEEAKNEPAWVKDGFFFKLPYKDQHGRSMYFDLTYIIPFGDIVSGGIFQRPVSQETGTKEALPLSIASNNPVFQVLKELTRNETFTGEQIFKASDSTEQVTTDITRHLMRTFAPPWVASNLSPGYDPRTGEKKQGALAGSSEADRTNLKKTTEQQMLSYLGLGATPMQADINASFKEWNQKKGLQTLLLENNIIENFSRNYIPKED